MNKVASQLLDLSENEPYGVKGARVILKLRSNNKEQNIGSFTLDQCTVSNFENILSKIAKFSNFFKYFEFSNFLTFYVFLGQHISNHFGIGANSTLQHFVKKLAWTNHQWLQMLAYQSSLFPQKSGFVQQRAKERHFSHLKRKVEISS